MYTFEYLLKTEAIPRDIIEKLETLGEFKGRQDFYMATKPDALGVLRETVLSQSTYASNAIEAITVAPNRLEALMAKRAEPRNQPEAEIAGYRNVLANIEGLADAKSSRIDPNAILAMHRELFRLANTPTAGHWKAEDNVIALRNERGEILQVVFDPPAAAVTPRFMRELCRHLDTARSTSNLPRPIIIAAFGLDFLCIHPFDDGNGRIARLLMHLMLLQEGFVVGRYVPLERLIFETKDAYFAALRASSVGWHDAVHDPYPWTRYFFDMLIRSYRELDKRVEAISTTAAPLAALIRDAAMTRREFAAGDLLAAFPKVSRAYVYRVIKELVEEGRVVRVERGHYKPRLLAT